MWYNCRQMIKESKKKRKLTALLAGCAFLLLCAADAGTGVGAPASLTGVVGDAFRDELDAHFHFLVIQNETGTHYATTTNALIDQGYVNGLVGAEVTISGVNDPASPPNRRYLGPTVFFAATNDMQVLKPAPEDPFAVPELDDLGVYGSNPAGILRFGRRRVHGRVLAVWQGRSVLLERTGRVPFSRIELGDSAPPACGAFIEAVGFAETDLSSLNLSRARWRPAGEEALPEQTVTDVTAKDLFSFNGLSAFNSTLHGKTVRLAGTVLTLTEGGRFQIGCDGTPVTIDVSALPAESQRPEIGSRASVVGVCILDLPNWRPNEVFPHARGLFITARTPDDIRILSHPSWWTARRLTAVILILLGGLAAILLWNLSLQALAARRARQLFKAELKRATSELRVKDRTRLAVELHDALSQSLTGVSMEVEAAIRHGTGNPDSLMRHLSVADKILKSCRNELKNSLWDLRNDALEERDLGEAIRRTLLPHVRDVDLKIRFNVPRSRLTDNVTHELLRIVRELTVNGISHGGATAIQVAGSLDGGDLLFSVRDNGAGFDPDTAPGVLQGHFGLEGVRERLRQLKGRLVFEPVAEGGMKATVTIPLHKKEKA